MSIVTQGFGSACAISVHGWGYYDKALAELDLHLIPSIINVLLLNPSIFGHADNPVPTINRSTFLIPALMSQLDALTPTIDLTCTQPDMIDAGTEKKPSIHGLLDIRPTLAFDSTPSDVKPALNSIEKENSPNLIDTLVLRPTFKK